MSHNVADSWKIIKIELGEGDYLYKVFACWYGSYTTGESWRLNSGITSYEIGDNYVNFHGYSGSVYVCNLNQEGHLTAYTQNILDNMLDKTKGKAYIIDFEEFVKEFKV